MWADTARGEAIAQTTLLTDSLTVTVCPNTDAWSPTTIYRGATLLAGANQVGGASASSHGSASSGFNLAGLTNTSPYFDRAGLPGSAGGYAGMGHGGYGCGAGTTASGVQAGLAIIEY